MKKGLRLLACGTAMSLLLSLGSVAAVNDIAEEADDKGIQYAEESVLSTEVDEETGSDDKTESADKVETDDKTESADKADSDEETGSDDKADSDDKTESDDKTDSVVKFTDMPEGIDGECLQRAVDNGLLTGFEDETVRPDEAITRAQMATIMVRALGAEKKADISEFSDVAEDEWYYEAMAKAVEMEAFKGNADKTLNPQSSITRQEAMIVLSRVFDLAKAEITVLDKFTDGNTVAEWAAEEVSRLVAGGFTEQEGELRPLDKMTRLEFARIMDRLVSVYIDEGGEYTGETLGEGNILVRADEVKLSEVENGSILFIGDGVKSTTELAECEFDRISVRGGKLLVSSGEYGDVRAIGKGTEIHMGNAPSELIRKNENGEYEGVFYGKPGYGTVVLTFDNIELQ